MSDLVPVLEAPPLTVTAIELLNSYAVIFIVAFLAALLATPIVRRIAVRHNIVDRPDQVRKVHTAPVAYLGGVAVFVGIFAGLVASVIFVDGPAAYYDPVPLAVVVGMVAIALTGMIDDIWKLDPRLKIAGQLVAAAGLAVHHVGVRVAAGILSPIEPFVDSWTGSQHLVFTLPFEIPLLGNQFDLIYWTGTAIVAIFVLGACNASNLIDGLDGLLSGTVAIVALGLLAISVMMAVAMPPATGAETMAGSRIALCLALLGAVLGFLPHNFNPATIFLGDCGSLLLGYMCIVIILMLGENGQTHLVMAGLILFALPIMDTTLAIIRRKLAGKSISSADDQHIHHQVKRLAGGVKSAVLALYGISIAFGLVGVTLAALVMFTELRVRIIYAVALILFSFIGVIAVKAARRERYRIAEVNAPSPEPPSTPARPEPMRVR
jgi:UDP-GlcNAc:undecaprenyl-phosphate/decaprenyl-phosphate GlcNAc-1-phosphate transferase